MRYIFFLLCLPIFAQQTTQIHDLRLHSLTKTGVPGEVLVSWKAEKGSVRYSSERFLIRFSQYESFIDANPVVVHAWTTTSELNLSHTLTLADGTWFISVGFQNSSGGVDIVAPGYGPVDGYWTNHGTVTVDNSFSIPNLILPRGDYTEPDIILAWTDPGPNIDQLLLQISSNWTFQTYETITMLPSENGFRVFSLRPFDEGVIYFRIKGLSNQGLETEWSRGSINYKPASIHRYYLAFVPDNDKTTTKVGIAILNDALYTTVRIGWKPPAVNGFEIDTRWAWAEAYQGSILLIDPGLILDANLQGEELILESNEPIAVSVYFDSFRFGDKPIHDVFQLDEGSSDYWVIPLLRADQDHRINVVVSNHDEERFATVEYIVRFPGVFNQNNQQFFRSTLTIPPGDNRIIDLPAMAEIPIDFLGYMEFSVLSPTDVAIIYSIRSEPIPGIPVYSYSSAQQR